MVPRLTPVNSTKIACVAGAGLLHNCSNMRDHDTPSEGIFCCNSTIPAFQWRSFAQLLGYRAVVDVPQFGLSFERNMLNLFIKHRWRFPTYKMALALHAIRKRQEPLLDSNP
jgi:hypothetical protein